MSAPVAALAVLVLVVFAAGTADVSDREPPIPPRRDVATASSDAAAARFLDERVDADGRVVRHDEGGDTVSEGQAYAMLLAVAAGDRDRFDLVWRWTVEHLQRPDGLLAWHWVDGRVVDDDPAADADIDAAHALALAAARFGDDAHRWQAAELGAAVLEHETVDVDGRRLLVAGPWARVQQPVLNPSYLSPLATTVLERTDARWRDIGVTGRIVLDQLAHERTGLVPDWAVLRDGDADAAPPPGGDGEPRFGFDAARVIVRYAAACDAEDRAVAARTWPFFERIVDGGHVVAAYSLDGEPATDHRHPLMLVAAAAAAAAAGEDERVPGLLDAAERVHEEHRTYYGAAWVALGRSLLDPRSALACDRPDGRRTP